MQQNTQQTLIEEILNLWIDLTGTDPDSKKIYFRFGDEFSVDAARDDLKQALALDETGLTALLMLNQYAEEFFQYKKFSLAEMISDSAPALEMIEKSKKLRTLLNHQDILSALNDFREKVIIVLNKLEAQKPAYEMLDDKATVGYLRRDAFRSMETLHCYQFSQGKTTSKNLHPVKSIFLFWDMPSVIRLGLTMPDCTFLGLVKDKNALASFFVLVAKNGENLTVYTDCPEWKHPLQKDMTRRPGREMSARIAKHHFPYGLMDIQFDYRGDAFIPQQKANGLSVIQNKLEVIGSITDLDPEETLWLIMILAMMDQALYKQNYHLPELSHSTEVLFENSLLAKTSQALCLRQDGSKFELPINTVDTLAEDPQWRKPDEGKDTVFGKVNYHVNSWLEEKYKDQVPHEAINGLLLSDDCQLILGPGDSKEIITKARAEIDAMGYFEKRDFEASHAGLRTLSGNEFGSIQHLEENYRFLARYNEAAVIDRLVEADYKSHAKEVSEWVRTCTLENLPQLILDLAEAWPRHDTDSDIRQRWCVLTLEAYKKKSEYGLCQFYQGSGNTWKDTRCALTGKAVSYVAYLRLHTLEDLMYVTGCKFAEKLPEWLRHWGRGRFYSGNHLLERVDPMAWVVKDRWAKMRFDSVIFLSKTAINNACKTKGISPSLFIPCEE